MTANNDNKPLLSVDAAAAEEEEEDGGSSSKSSGSEEDSKCWRSRAAACVGLCICGVCLLLISLGLAAFLSVNVIARIVIERSCSRSFGLPTTVKSVSVALFGGQRSTLQGLTVANPTGYELENFLKVEEGSVDMNIWSLLHRHVVVKEVDINHLTVNLEQNDTILSPSNLEVVTHSLKESERNSVQIPDALGGKFSERLLSIDELDVKDVVINAGMQGVIGAQLASQAPPLSYHIPEVVLRDIGKNSGGVPLDDLMKTLVKAVIVAGLQAAPQNIAEGITSSVNSWAQDLFHLNEHIFASNVGAGLHQIARYAEKVGENLDAVNSTVAWEEDAPALVRSSRYGPELGSAFVTAKDAGAEAADAFADATNAFGELAQQHEMTADGFEGAINKTIASIEGRLSETESRTQHDGVVGKFLSSAIAVYRAMGGHPW